MLRCVSCLPGKLLQEESLASYSPISDGAWHDGNVPVDRGTSHAICWAHRLRWRTRPSRMWTPEFSTPLLNAWFFNFAAHLHLKIRR